MALTNTFVKDMYLLYEGTLHYVLDRQYKTQGRQGGLIILKMRNMQTGNIKEITIKSGMKLEEVDVETKELQYLYKDDSSAYFMETTTFENLPLSLDVIGDYIKYMKEGDTLLAAFYNGKAINVKKNPSVTLEVTQAQDAVKGNTATNAMKEVTVETGFTIKVPMFVRKGDKIIINTDSGEYTGRSN